MLTGIVLVIIGLGMFIGAGVKLDDAPGVEKTTVVVMLVGLAFIAVGGIELFMKAFGL